jgi:hypothetical protein
VSRHLSRLVGDGDGDVLVAAHDCAHRVDALDDADQHARAGAGRDLHAVAHQERLRQELRRTNAAAVEGARWATAVL